MATEEPLPTGDHLNSTDEDVQQRLCIYIIPAIVGGEIKPRSPVKYKSTWLIYSPNLPFS